MYDLLKGNGLIVFSDPAGAKACLGLASILKQRNISCDYQLISNRSYEFFQDWDIPVTVDSKFTISEKDNLQWIFTGTSHPESSGAFELKLIQQAVKLKIPSWAFIDHWTALTLRFRHQDRLVWPDKIVVVDEHARTLAVADGIPHNLLTVHANPYIEYIGQCWQPRHTPIEIKKLLGIRNRGYFTILYAPDPLSLRNEDREWGFNEVTVLAELIEVLKEAAPVNLLIKAHPLQPQGPLQELIAQSQYPYIYNVSSANNLELMSIADLVIGFHSNFLIEANALGKDIIRYFPQSAEKDPLQHLHIGTRLASKKELLITLKNKIMR